MKKYRQPYRPKKSSLIIGIQKVLNALQTGEHLDRVYILKNAHTKDLDEIGRLCRFHHVPLSYVPVEKLNSFHVTDHEGCVAQKARVHYQQLQDVISHITDEGQTPLFVILDGITDIRNIGGIARTAFCTGVHALIIPDKGVGVLNEDALNTSAGALEQITVCRVGSLLKTVEELHLNGITVVGTAMQAEKDFDNSDFTLPTAVILGSEEKGIHPALLKACDSTIKIPMAGNFESLNVSVAAGIILYEALKQRRSDKIQ